MLKHILLFLFLTCRSQDYTFFTGEWEGFSASKYRDNGGWSIGFGFHLSDPSATNKMLKEGMLASQYLHGKTITVEEAERLLRNDLKESILDANRIFLNFENRPPKIKEILVDLRYNLGPNKLRKFKKFIAFINQNDYKRAAIELKNSEWFSQVHKQRAFYHVQTLWRTP